MSVMTGVMVGNAAVRFAPPTKNALPEAQKACALPKMADAVPSILKQLTALQAQVEQLARPDNVKRAKDPMKDAIYLDGACPAPMVACGSPEAARMGMVCPDANDLDLMDDSFSNPLMVDSNGRMCRLPDVVKQVYDLPDNPSVDHAIQNASAKLAKLLADKSNVDRLLRIMQAK